MEVCGDTSGKDMLEQLLAQDVCPTLEDIAGVRESMEECVLSTLGLLDDSRTSRVNGSGFFTSLREEWKACWKARAGEGIKKEALDMVKERRVSTVPHSPFPPPPGAPRMSRG